jgi:hypothetical protein
MSIVQVGLRLQSGARRIQCGAGQAVAGFERRTVVAVFDEARFKVLVCASPACMR